MSEFRVYYSLAIFTIFNDLHVLARVVNMNLDTCIMHIGRYGYLCSLTDNEKCYTVIKRRHDENGIWHDIRPEFVFFEHP